jgi:hypothetical protein
MLISAAAQRQRRKVHINGKRTDRRQKCENDRDPKKASFRGFLVRCSHYGNGKKRRFGTTREKLDSVVSIHAVGQGRCPQDRLLAVAHLR